MKFVKRYKIKIGIFSIIVIAVGIFAIILLWGRPLPEVQGQGCIGLGGSGCATSGDCCLVGADCFRPGDLADLPENYFCCGPYSDPSCPCSSADLTDSGDSSGSDVNVDDLLMCTSLYASTPSCAQHSCLECVSDRFGEECCTTDRCQDYYDSGTDYSTCAIGCGADNQLATYSTGVGCGTCYCCESVPPPPCNQAECISQDPINHADTDYGSCTGCGADDYLGFFNTANCGDNTCECCEIVGPVSVGFIKAVAPDNSVIKLNLISVADAIAAGRGVVKVVKDSAGNLAAADLVDVGAADASPVRIYTGVGGGTGIWSWRELP